MKVISIVLALLLADSQAIKFTDFMGEENGTSSMLAEVKNMQSQNTLSLAAIDK